MSAASAAARALSAPGLAPAGPDDRAVPAHARQLAAQLSALFERDVEIVERLNDAQHRLQDANERLWSGLAPDAFGLIYDGAAAAAIGTSQVAALHPRRRARCQQPMLEALQTRPLDDPPRVLPLPIRLRAAPPARGRGGRALPTAHQTRSAPPAGAHRQAQQANVHELASASILDRRPTRIVATTPLSGQPERLRVATPSRSSRRSRTHALRR